MDCSTPGFPVLQHFLEFAQTHVHRFSDAIQSSVVPFSCLQSFPASGFFSKESVLPVRWLKYWSFNFSISPSSEYSRLISFRVDWLDLLARRSNTGTASGCIWASHGPLVLVSASLGFCSSIKYFYISSGLKLYFREK